MKRLFKLKNIKTGKYHCTESKQIVHKGTKRKPNNKVATVVYFEDKQRAKEVRKELGSEWRITIAEDHRRYMG